MYVILTTQFKILKISKPFAVDVKLSRETVANTRDSSNESIDLKYRQTLYLGHQQPKFVES